MALWLNGLNRLNSRLAVLGTLSTFRRGIVLAVAVINGHARYVIFPMLAVRSAAFGRYRLALFLSALVITVRDGDYRNGRRCVFNCNCLLSLVAVVVVINNSWGRMLIVMPIERTIFVMLLHLVLVVMLVLRLHPMVVITLAGRCALLHPFLHRAELRGFFLGLLPARHGQMMIGRLLWRVQLLIMMMVVVVMRTTLMVRALRIPIMLVFD